MTVLGREHAATIAEAHPLPYDTDFYFDGYPIFHEDGISLDRLEVSVFSESALPPFQAALDQHLMPIIGLEKAIAESMGKHCVLPGDKHSPWRLAAKNIRSNLKPESRPTGKLRGFTIDLVAPSELTEALGGQQASSEPDAKYSLIEHTQLPLILRAQYVGGLGKLVACAMDIRLCTHERSEDAVYIGGRLLRLPVTQPRRSVT